MNKVQFAPPFPKGVEGDNPLIEFITHLGLPYQTLSRFSSRFVLVIFYS